MKKLLIIGNSQASSLFSAFKRDPAIFGKDNQVHFYCVPGGLGPAFTVEEDRLILSKHSVNPKFPPYCHPLETIDMPLSGFDVILVSALGLIGGSIGGAYPLMWQGLLHSFGPKSNTWTERPLSDSAYQVLVNEMLRAQAGFRFLNHLAQSRVRTIIQPFPMLSKRVLQDPHWILNQLYCDAAGAMRHFNHLRNSVLADVCSSVSFEILSYPDSSWVEDGFTPEGYIDHPDGLHTNEKYARRVIETLRQTIDAYA